MASSFIPYGRQSLHPEDVQSILQTLESGWLTTGPQVETFEKAVADYLPMGHAIAVSSGTAALHCAMYAIEIGPGDEVIVPPLTFAATSNAVLYQGGTPVFADVDPETLSIDPVSVRERLTGKTRAIVAVDYAGQPCDYKALRAIADEVGLVLIADSCHSLGAGDAFGKCGTHADLSVFSFHPVKPITTAEGGMIVTRQKDWADRMRCFRNHGITTDHRQRQAKGAWHYEMVELGFNYRLSDLQCSLGLSQMKKIDSFVAERNKQATRYRQALQSCPGIEPLAVRENCLHGHHLFVVRTEKRDELFQFLRERDIGSAVHYPPVHLHPYYRQTLQTGPGLCPVAEEASDRILSLPIFPGLGSDEQERVIEALQEFGR